MQRLNRKMSINLVSVSVLAFAITIILVSASVIFADVVTIPNAFSPGTTISSSQMNANFLALSKALPAYKDAAFHNVINLNSNYQNLVSLTVTPPTVGGYFMLFRTATASYQAITGGNTTVCVTQTSQGSDLTNG